MFNRITSKKYVAAGMEKIFESGFREFARLRKQGGIDAAAVLAGSQRSMRVALSREIDELEVHLSFLATVGSTSPYVGLFGTVWGIMNSFRALGNVNQATLAMVTRERRAHPPHRRRPTSPAVGGLSRAEQDAS